MKEMMYWMDYRKSTGCVTDQGWLHAIAAAPNPRKRYHAGNFPVWEPSPVSEWREQTTLGSYCDYSDRPNPILGMVHVNNTSKWFATIAEAKEWIKSEAIRLRPDLIVAIAA